MTDGDEVAAIERLIADGDDDAAYTRLRTAIGWPAGKLIAAPELPRYLALVGELATRRGAGPLGELAAETARDPDSPDRLYDLGYAQIDAGAPQISATVLWRCLALVGESEEVVCELVSALERALAYVDALEVLAEHPALRQRSFLCRYLYAFNAAMAGQLELTRATRHSLVPDSTETEHMAATINGILARADRVADLCSLDQRDLRGWHYVLFGSLLAHQSPYGYDAPMHGRYAWLTDTYGRIATGLDRLRPLTASLDLPCVYAPPGRGHEILALAAAEKLGLPLAPWPAVGIPAPGLVVLYDLAELAQPDVARLVQRRADQILYAHASPWTHDCPVAPDVTMLLYQTLVAPWGEAVFVDPATQEVGTASADERPAGEVAAEIVASGGLQLEDRVADEPEKWQALVERVWPPEPGPRSRLWAGGPVPSSRFS